MVLVPEACVAQPNQKNLFNTYTNPYKCPSAQHKRFAQAHPPTSKHTQTHLGLFFPKHEH